MQQAFEAPEGMPFTDSTQPPPPPVQDTAAQTPPAQRTGFNVGRILNLTGVVFLVLGAVFLLAYSWQSMPAFIRVALAMLGVIGLIGGGEYCTMRLQENKWFGQGLVAGGYALGYFVVYAMENVQAVKVIDNPALDLCLLLAFTVASISHAIWRKSEFMAILSTSLALLTISLNPITMFSIAACALLTSGTAFAVTKMRWYNLHAVSCLGSYLTFGVFTAREISFLDPQITALISLGFLTAIWLANSISTIALAESGEKEGLVGTMMVLNSALFVGMGLLSLQGVFSGCRFIFLNAVAAFYWRTSRMFRSRKINLEPISKLTALTLSTAAVPLELVDNAVPAFLLAEISLLTYAGLKYKQAVFRLFAGLLTVYTWLWVTFGVIPHPMLVTWRGITLQWPLVTATIAVLSYMFSAWCYRLPQFKAVQTTGESSLAPVIYILSACTVSLILPFHMALNPLATMIWPITALLLIAAGFALNDKDYRAIGLTFFAGAAVKLLFFDLASANILERSASFVVAGIAFLLGSSAYAWLGNRIKSPPSEPSPN
jgi:uncharacterized membrane protein